MKYLPIVVLLALAGCEYAQKTTAERVEAEMNCHWLPKNKVCICFYGTSGTHVPNRMCDVDK